MHVQGVWLFGLVPFPPAGGSVWKEKIFFETPIAL